MNPLRYLRITLAMALKDLQVIYKDRGLLIVIIGLPMAFAMLNGVVNQRFAENARESRIFPVVLVNHDSGIFGQQIEITLNSLDVLRVMPLTSEEEAKQQVLDSQALAAIIIPANLTQQIQAYQPSQVQVVTDPTQEQFASLITGLMKEVITPVVIQGEISFAIRTLLAEHPAYLQANEGMKRAIEAQNMAVQMSQVQKMQADPWVDVELKTKEGKDLVIVPANLFVLLVPSFTVLFAFFIVGSMSSEILKEKEEGSLRRLVAAPIHPWMIIAAKMLAYVVLVIVQVALIFGIANIAFDMPIGNSITGLLLVSISMGLAATGIGMLVASLSRSNRQADTIGILLGFVLGALGGCFVISSPVPLYKGGGVMETIAKLTPQAHALWGYDILLNEGGTLSQVIPQALTLIGFALAAFAIASLRFKFEF